MVAWWLEHTTYIKKRLILSCSEGSAGLVAARTGAKGRTTHNQADIHLYIHIMPRTPKAMKDEDIKPYNREESQASSKSPSKAPSKKSAGDAWTPDQVWALFNQLYKKGAPSCRGWQSSKRVLRAGERIILLQTKSIGKRSLRWLAGTRR